jgi:hypothetical protein
VVGAALLVVLALWLNYERGRQKARSAMQI